MAANLFMGVNGGHPDNCKMFALVTGVSGVQIGAEVPEGRFKVGERVMALLSGGGYAEEVRLHCHACRRFAPLGSS